MFLSVNNWPMAKERLQNIAEDGHVVLVQGLNGLCKYESMFKLVSTLLKFSEKVKFL